MQTSDWLGVVSSVGTWIIPVTALVMWGISSIFESRGSARTRQNELLARLATQLEKPREMRWKR